MASRVVMASSGSCSSSSVGGGSGNLVDASWELIDPCPDVHALFLQFNDQFFWGRLSGCEVRWSPKMTLCAGQCHYEGRGGLCSIRLSNPLLKLRPRKDLVETLLDHDGHGPNFHSHMNRINALAGTRITVFHSFHAEVAEYRQHWWRCQGPCRYRGPYYGWVKRATNRSPGPNDFWWKEHQENCGGQYVKVKEPEGYQEKKKNQEKNDKNTSAAPGKLKDSNQQKITAFWGKGYVLGSSVTVGGTSSQKVKKNPPQIQFWKIIPCPRSQKWIGVIKAVEFLKIWSLVLYVP